MQQSTKTPWYGDTYTAIEEEIAINAVSLGKEVVTSVQCHLQTDIGTIHQVPRLAIGTAKQIVHPTLHTDIRFHEESEITIKVHVCMEANVSIRRGFS